MFYLTNGYKIKEFENKNLIYKYIKEDLDKQNLNYKLVFKDTKSDIEILIFQYHTLYLETYIIHTNLDLRKRSYLYE